MAAPFNPSTEEAIPANLFILAQQKPCWTSRWQNNRISETKERRRLYRRDGPGRGRPGTLNMSGIALSRLAQERKLEEGPPFWLCGCPNKEP